jgi:drug/metabolite transporter (DMT)-like permease
MDAIELAIGQFAVCSILSLAFAQATEPAPFAGTFAAAIPILYGGIMSTGIAFTLQIVAQRKAHPAHASIILSMEALFAGIGGVIILGESVTARLVAGGLIMLGGMIVSQLDPGTPARAKE